MNREAFAKIAASRISFLDTMAAQVRGRTTDEIVSEMSRWLMWRAECRVMLGMGIPQEELDLFESEVFEKTVRYQEEPLDKETVIE